MLQSQHLLSPNFNFPFSLSHSQTPSHSPPSSSLSLNLVPRPITLHSVSSRHNARPEIWLAQAPEPATTAVAEDGPIELPPSSPSLFATSDDPSPLQVATSVLLTGAIFVFLFRSLRRRAKRAKELRFRSSGATKSSTKSLKEEAIETLKAMAPASDKGPPSPIQALLGGISAGVIALILYKFTSTVESSLNRQTIPDNISVRQLTITIRTIINGICYLATFVFGINSVGLFLYSVQLTFNALMGDSSSEENEKKDAAEMSSNPTSQTPLDSSGRDIRNGDQSSDSTQ